MTSAAEAGIIVAHRALNLPGFGRGLLHMGARLPGMRIEVENTAAMKALREKPLQLEYFMGYTLCNWSGLA
jgi:hypothetical protein